MSLPVLTAITDSVVESALLTAFSRASLGITVTRRCVDVADLLATAGAGTGRAALVSADLRRLDQQAVAGLRARGVAVVGLVPVRDEGSERRLRQIGLDVVLPADATPERVAAALTGLAARTGGPAGDRDAGAADRRAADTAGAVAAGDFALPCDPAGAGTGGSQGGPVVMPDSLADLDALSAGTGQPGAGAEQPAPGQVVAVWGPAGAPGRTTVALGLAGELAAGGLPVLLVDADPYGGCVAQLLGMIEEAPGIAAAARAANSGALDVARLASLARTVDLPGGGALRVLTGISRAARWTELRSAALDTVITVSRRLAAVTVVDCGFSLEQDEELVYDTLAPQRNAATLSALAAADVVLAVGSADPVGLTRLVRGLAELRTLAPSGRVWLVVNRLRASAVPGVGRLETARREVERAIARHAGMRPVAVIPQDVPAIDRATARGALLCVAASDSPARQALTELAAAVVGSPWRARRRRRLLRGVHADPGATAATAAG